MGSVKDIVDNLLASIIYFLCFHAMRRYLMAMENLT
jgi:hypothetical protein